MTLLLLVMLASGGAELVSLGAVLPFLAILNDPQGLYRHPLLQELARSVGITSASQLLLPSILAFVIATVLSALIRLTNLWLNGRLAAAVGSDLSCEAYERTLYQPYAVHMKRNSSTVISASTTKINMTVGALNSFLQLITSGVVTVALFIGMVLIDWIVALVATLLFGISYALLVFVTRHELEANGRFIAAASSIQVKVLQEGLGAIRDMVLGGTQQNFLRIYRQVEYPQRRLWAKNVFLTGFPRYAFEALGMVALALIGAVLVLQRGNGAAVVPLLGAIAMGAQRLLPALQQIYSSWTNLRGCAAAIHDVLSLLNQPLPAKVVGVTKPHQLNQGIRFESVCFRYGPNQQEVLKDIDFEVHRGESIGFIGKTGSGKSTTVDLLMGLIAPSSGRVLVDGEDLNDPDHPERLLAWRLAIAHVPQSIYLLDSSIAENIALGVPLRQIDMSRVAKAAAQAKIARLIESFPDSYRSMVGERGISLSGGQRQRIGIARALYKQAHILVFDEATSALDGDTEEAIMTTIEELSERMTIVMIAHRLSTVQKCSRVVRLENGRIFADGPPNAVLRNGN